MTDFFKDVFDAAQQRIRSPFLSSILLAFIVFNWQALFYLLFEDASISARLTYFNMKTDSSTLYEYPFAWGIALAFGMPWLKLAGAWIAMKPTALLSDLQNNEASRRRVNRLNLKAVEDDALENANKARELRKIEEARRLNEAVKVGGAELEADIQETRIQEIASDDSITFKEKSNEAIVQSLDTLSKTIIAALGETTLARVNLDQLHTDRGFLEIVSKFGYPHSGVRLKQETKQAMRGLVQKGLLESTAVSANPMRGAVAYTAGVLSLKGFAVYDIISEKYSSISKRD